MAPRYCNDRKTGASNNHGHGSWRGLFSKSMILFEPAEVFRYNSNFPGA